MSEKANAPAMDRGARAFPCAAATLEKYRADTGGSTNRFDQVAFLARLAWRLLPLVTKGKRPLLDGWRDKATADLGAIEARALASPECNWGAATGAASGVWALDLDGDEGRRALETLIAEHGSLPLAPCQRTGGGGWQLFFAWPDDRIVRNSASKVAPNVDVRGDGGFVVVPPSLHPSGNRYRWLGGRAPWEIDPPAAPRWLLDLVAPRPKPRPASPPKPRLEAGGRYAQAALTRAVETVMAAPEGARNTTLNAEAFSTARLIGDGLPEGAWRDALATAAAHAGLDQREIDATLASALRGRLEARHG